MKSTMGSREGIYYKLSEQQAAEIMERLKDRLVTENDLDALAHEYKISRATLYARVIRSLKVTHYKIYSE